MNDLRTHLRRFKTASVPEILYRLRHLMEDRRLRRRLGRGQDPAPIPVPEPGGVLSLACPAVSGVPDEGLVREILAGKTFTLNAPDEAVSAFEARWRGRFSRDVRPDPGVDIRAVWEPARLQHLAVLLRHAGLHAGTRREDEVLRLAVEGALRWVRENPLLTGPHYASPMECGLRIPVLFACMKEVRNPDDFPIIARAIFGHAWWIARRLSLFASLGNHTVSECVGLVFAGAVFRGTKEGRAWLRRGIGLLDQELWHQVLPDGGPAEQSLAYHRFVLDLYWLAADFLESNGLHGCLDWKARLAAGEEFLAAFSAGGAVPAIGDADDGCAVAPGLAPVRVSAPGLSDAARTFPAAGYSLVRLGEDGLLVLDHGPLGMAPLYNHGHADALSVLVSKGGRGILADPGTYRYNGVPEWRRYFKGTSAHNTVTVDGLDQAVQETGFIWSAPYSARLVRTEADAGRILLEAEHDGYRRLSLPVTHRRTVEVRRDGGRIDITDRFGGRGVHAFALHFHLPPEAGLVRDGGAWRIENGGVRALMRIDGGEVAAVRGSRDPVLGWHSPEYGRLEESWTLRARARGEAGDVSFETAISFP